MWNLKKKKTTTNKFIYKKNRLTDIEGESGAGVNEDLGVHTHTLPYVKQIISKDLCRAEGSTQYSVTTYM